MVVEAQALYLASDDVTGGEGEGRRKGGHGGSEVVKVCFSVCGWLKKFSLLPGDSFFCLFPWLERAVFPWAFFVCTYWHFWVAIFSRPLSGIYEKQKDNPENTLLCYSSNPKICLLFFTFYTLMLFVLLCSVFYVYLAEVIGWKDSIPFYLELELLLFKSNLHSLMLKYLSITNFETTQIY